MWSITDCHNLKLVCVPPLNLLSDSSDDYERTTLYPYIIVWMAILSFMQNMKSPHANKLDVQWQ